MPMFKVELSTHAEDHERRLFAAATRTIELPFPPYPGLELRWGDVEGFSIKDVSYFPDDGVFTADEDGSVLNPAYETLEEWADSLRGAGFEIHGPDPLDPETPPKKRHLRSVSHSG